MANMLEREIMNSKRSNYFTFSTDNCKYIFDNVSGEIIASDDELQYIIEHYYRENPVTMLTKFSFSSKTIFETKYNYVKWMIEQGMFYSDAIVNSNNTFTLESVKHSGTSQLILVLTEKCNMRCEYCIYSEKYPLEMSYSDQELDYDSAVIAINEYFKIHREKERHGYSTPPRITFYGGEPLLKIDLIKRIVAYVEDVEPKSTFYMTTNGLLLDGNVADYVSEHKFMITVSIDGYKENHDRNRVTFNQAPTFDKIFHNIINYQKMKRSKNITQVINFNCCYDNYTDLEKCVQFFEDNYDLLYPFWVIYSRVAPFDTSYYDWTDERLRSNRDFDKNALDNSRKILGRMFYESDFPNDKLRELVTCLFLGDFSILTRERWTLSGFRNACTPLSKLAVYPDGTYALCEKMNKKLPIGNVNDGIDYNLLTSYARSLIDNYDRKECSCCPVSRLCTVCFMYMDENGVINSKFCESQKKYIRNNLQNLYAALEKNPDILNNFAISSVIEAEIMKKDEFGGNNG